MPVKIGDKIKVDYEGKLDDGTVFDDSKKHGHPLEFEVGAKQVIKGFEEAVIGMEVNEEKEIKIQPKDAYGEENQDLMKKVPRDQLPPDQEPKVGMVLMATTPEGTQIPLRIIKVDEEGVTLNMNHPLAGKVLNFKLKVVGIN